MNEVLNLFSKINIIEIVGLAFKILRICKKNKLLKLHLTYQFNTKEEFFYPPFPFQPIMPSNIV